MKKKLSLLLLCIFSCIACNKYGNTKTNNSSLRKIANPGFTIKNKIFLCTINNVAWGYTKVSALAISEQDNKIDHVYVSFKNEISKKNVETIQIDFMLKPQKITKITVSILREDLNGNWFLADYGIDEHSRTKLVSNNINGHINLTNNFLKGEIKASIGILSQEHRLKYKEDSILKIDQFVFNSIPYTKVKTN